MARFGDRQHTDPGVEEEKAVKPRSHKALTVQRSFGAWSMNDRR